MTLYLNPAENADNTARTCMSEEDFDANFTNPTRPIPSMFSRYLSDFLKDNPHGTRCPVAGHPMFGSSPKSIVVDNKTGTPVVGANNRMAYHTILRKSKDFTKGDLQINHFLYGLSFHSWISLFQTSCYINTIQGKQ